LSDVCSVMIGFGLSTIFVFEVFMIMELAKIYVIKNNTMYDNNYIPPRVVQINPTDSKD
jgi:hypothetical protein